MLKSFKTRLELWISILIMKMLRKKIRSNMLSQDLKDKQHCGGMNYKLTDAAKASKKLRVGIEWLQR
jgi:hypothetical protein